MARTDAEEDWRGVGIAFIVLFGMCILLWCVFAAWWFIVYRRRNAYRGSPQFQQVPPGMIQTVVPPVMPATMAAHPGIHHPPMGMVPPQMYTARDVDPLYDSYAYVATGAPGGPAMYNQALAAGPYLHHQSMTPAPMQPMAF